MAEIPRHDDPEGLVRRLRQELDRMRDAEREASDALGKMRSARKRAEDLAGRIDDDRERVRSLVREELWAAGVARTSRRSPGGGDAGTAAAASPGGERNGAERQGRQGRPEDRREERQEARQEPAPPVEGERTPRSERIRRWWMGAAALVLLTVVAVASWLVFHELQGEPEDVRVAGDAPGAQPAAAAAGDAEEAEDPEAQDPEGDASLFFSRLPEEAQLRGQVYDSLWTARSPLFDPLLQRVEELSDQRSVQRALEAWREGGMSALQEDVLHSALVQLVLRREVDGDLAVDGTLLRNPCRGESCSALLNLWEIGQEEYPLPEMPEDAPRNTRALHTAEAVLVLDALERASGG